MPFKVYCNSHQKQINSNLLGINKQQFIRERTALMIHTHSPIEHIQLIICQVNWKTNNKDPLQKRFTFQKEKQTFK